MRGVRVFLRMARLVRNPPSKQRQWLVGIVLGLAFLIAGYDWLIGLPDWMAVDLDTMKIRPQ